MNNLGLRRPEQYKVTAPVLIAVAGVLIILGAAAYKNLTAMGTILPRPFCLFNKMTGIPCPTCGTTRAFLALVQLDIRTAFGYQPLIMLVTLGSIVLACVDISIWVLSRQQIIPWLLERTRLSSWGLIAVILANWIYVILNLNSHILGWLFR